MTIEPKTQREHIISLHGHITGLKKEVEDIKSNHLKNIHEEIDKLGGKIDKIYWVVLSTVGAVGLMVLETFIQMFPSVIL